MKGGYRYSLILLLIITINNTTASQLQSMITTTTTTTTQLSDGVVAEGVNYCPERCTCKKIRESNVDGLKVTCIGGVIKFTQIKEINFGIIAQDILQL